MYLGTLLSEHLMQHWFCRYVVCCLSTEYGLMSNFCVSHWVQDLFELSLWIQAIERSFRLNPDPKKKYFWAWMNSTAKKIRQYVDYSKLRSENRKGADVRDRTFISSIEWSC